MAWLGAALVLGVAGFDPLGAVALTAAATAGARRGALLTLGATTIATTGLVSLLAVLGLGPVIHRWEERLWPTPFAWHLVAVIAGLGLLAWAGWRLSHRQTGSSDEGTPPRSVTTGGMVLTGVLVGGSSLVDPAWYAMVAYAARLSPAPAAAVALIWTALSHVLLIALTVAVMGGGYERLDRALTRLRSRYAPAIRWSVTGLALIGGLALVVYGLVALV